MILYRYNKIQLCVFFHKIFSYLRFLVLISGLATGTLRIGCFKDDTQRDLTGFSMTSELLTVELCVDTCRGRGFLFAGLEEGNQCFCGNSVGRYGTADPSTCNSTCAGNVNQACGGYWRLDVLFIGML